MSEFRIAHLKVADLQMASLYATAKAEGRGGTVVDAFRDIVQQLKTRPHEFGERLNHIRSLHLYTYQGAVAPIAVYYAVHEVEHFVVIKTFTMMGAGGPASTE